jgi:hypothetical protein
MVSMVKLCLVEVFRRGRWCNCLLENNGKVLDGKIRKSKRRVN